MNERSTSDNYTTASWRFAVCISHVATHYCNHPYTTPTYRIKACVDFLSLHQWSLKSPINLLGSTWIRPPPSTLHGIVCPGAGTMWLYQSSANTTLCGVWKRFLFKGEWSVMWCGVFFCDNVAVGLSVGLGNLWCCSAADRGCWCVLASAILLYEC